MSDLQKLRRFKSRAEHLHLKAENLFIDMMEQFGEEGQIGSDQHHRSGGADNATDFIDNVLYETERLCGMLDRAIALRKAQRNRRKSGAA